MNGRIFFWSLTSALAGFLFGFDTVVISGAEKTIQALWGLSPGLHGIAMASALYGTVVSSVMPLNKEASLPNSSALRIGIGCSRFPAASLCAPVSRSRSGK